MKAQRVLSRLMQFVGLVRAMQKKLDSLMSLWGLAKVAELKDRHVNQTKNALFFDQATF